ncbi:hypothetical protein AFLA_011588 [Aspergillus flavus NRRL3357]|nr:hypothetical protein AFLA_011588 [Aspergillus flavus NRRL3357]
METHINTHSQLIKRLRAQPVSVPNLLPIFSSWPGAVNPHWRALVPVMNARIDSLFPEPAKATKLKRCDFAHLASTRWPLAGFNELYILAFLSLWLVTWDDQIDDTKRSLSNDFEAAEQYRRETLYFVAQCLDLDITEGLPRSYNDSIFVPDDPIVQSFDVIGEALRDAYTYEQRHRFLREMSLFMVTSHMEQKAKLEGHIPSLEEYWRVRMGTSAVGVICAVNEYSLRSVIPCAIMEDHDMRTMWNEVNVIASIVNDIYSLKKEMAQDTIYSLIPILCMSLGSPQAAIDNAIRSLIQSVGRFNIAANQLMDGIEEEDRFSLSLGVKRDVEDFIRSCQFNCTGCLYWTLRTNRYGVRYAPRSSDGGVVLHL